MKKIILFLFAFMIANNVISQTSKCPVTGDSKRKEDQSSDSLKNRNSVGKKVEQKYIGEMLKSGNDLNRFTPDEYVRVRGMITEVKHGGSEQCNCHSSAKEDLDIHIVFSDSLGQGKIICEINRYTQASDKTLNYHDVHDMIGKQVYIYGYLFADFEHKQNANNTCVTCTNVWRSSIWEIHPVMKIEVLNVPSWK